jgi:hypothetical protein
MFSNVLAGKTRPWCWTTKYRREEEPKKPKKKQEQNMKKNQKTREMEKQSGKTQHQKHLRVPFWQSGFENLPTEGKESLEFAIFRISKADTPNRNVSQFSKQHLHKY